MSTEPIDATIVDPDQPIERYDAVRAGLAELHTMAESCPVVVDKASRKAVREVITRITRTRTDLDKHRLDLGRPLRQFVDRINSEGKLLIAELREMAEPLEAKVAAYDAEIAAAKAEKERIEAERVAEIQRHIRAIESYPIVCANASVADIQQAQLGLAATVIDENTFQEFVSEAAFKQQIAAADLIKLEAAAREREDIEAAERAERQRKEAEAQAEREALEIKQREIAEREAQLAARESEIERKEREAREQAEAEKRAEQAAQDAAERRERKQAREQRKVAAQDAIAEWLLVSAKEHASGLPHWVKWAAMMLVDGRVPGLRYHDEAPE